MLWQTKTQANRPKEFVPVTNLLDTLGNKILEKHSRTCKGIITWIRQLHAPRPFVTSNKPQQVFNPCMMSMKTMGTILKNTYSNAEFQTLRKNMLDGIWDEKGCESCKNAEDNGRWSPRLKWLDREEKYLGETGIYEAHTNIVKNDIHPFVHEL